MALFCDLHSARIYDRGGERLIGSLGNLSRVKWERLRDDISQATVYIAARSVDCDTTLGLSAAGRHELVIFRGNERVWEGPITHIAYTRNSVELTARDVGHYPYRAFMTQEYDNTYPNIGTVTSRMKRILETEMVRFEAQDPPINFLPHLVVHEDPDNAGTSAHTLPYEMTVYEHLDNFAARGGLDYTCVGRSMHLWDVHKQKMGKTAPITEEDFIGEVVITEYGMELATVSAITDGKGRAGVAGEADPYYGLVEILDTAYDEATGDEWDTADGVPGEPEPPSIAEMKSQAQRVLAGRNPTPIVVRVPDNSTLNPLGVLTIADLIPGVMIPLQANLPGRALSQLQKLDRVTVEETGEGETIQVVLSPAPVEGSNEEDT
jgi:hypothetical protein